MSLNKRLTASVITFVVILSVFLVPLTDRANAEDELFDAESILEIINLGKQLIDFDNVMDPHPFRFIGVWNSNDTMTINGSMAFDLYFSSTILTQLEFLEFQDSIKISVHHKDESGLVKQVEGANLTMTLTPEFLTEFVQDYHITLNDIYLEIEENDQLIFIIEIVQSEKPLNDFVEKRFDTKIKNRIEKIINLMKKTGDPDLENISIMVEDVLNNLSELDIDGDEFGALVNVLVSSAFYYGSNSYPSLVKFSTEEGDNHTLYFQNEIDYSFESTFTDFGYIKMMNSTAPSVDANYAYPPIAVNIDELTITEINEDEWLSWLAIWALYVYEGPTDTENRVTYYLHSGGKMNSTKPDGTDKQRDKLSTSPTSWTGPSFNRNKILKNATADLYIYHTKLLTFKNTKITATLKQDNTTLATSEAEIDRTTILEKLKRGAETPTRFYFEDLNNPEIWYNKDLTLEISVADQPFSLFKSAIISYDSSQYPSKITLSYAETDNIKLKNVEDKEVYAGGKIEYTLDVESNHSDTIDVTIDELDSIGDWDYTVSPSELQIGQGETKKITVTVESKATDADAYDNEDFIQLAINLSGNTGYSGSITNVSVSEAEVEYDIDIVTPEDIKIKHGSEGTFTFNITNNNKGFMADRYTFSIKSEHGWTLEYTSYIQEYLEVSEEAEVTVNITVPWYTDIKTEKITIEITSYVSEKYDAYTQTATMNITIGEPNPLDDIYHFFENGAKALGLDNISAKYAGWMMLLLLIIVVMAISLIIVIVKIRKFIELHCSEKIKEISPDETATYEITIKNPHGSVLTYEIGLELQHDNPRGWDVSLDTTQVMIEPKQERKIKLYVKTTDYIKKDDWIETKVIVKPIEKNKTADISTVTSIKNGKVDVKMSGVFHWPRVFKKDDRVETSFKLFNRGNVSADKASIILYVNGEEKNKVEDITIPRGGHADISIPWIAVKGKNEVYIVVN